MRRFYLEREEDVSGVSGTGSVAVGVQFPHHVVLEWQAGGIHSVVVYNNIEELIAVSGHGGKTKVVWIDEE
jgi:hypothetical protein